MKINLKNSLLSLSVTLFILANIVFIYKIDRIDRTVLIEEPVITQKSTLKETLQAEGDTEPSDIYKVFYEENIGTLSEVLVEEGQEVQAGTPLLTYSIEKNMSSEMVLELEGTNERLNMEKDKLYNDLSVLQEEKDDYANSLADDEQQPDLDNTRMIEYEMKNIEYEIKMLELQMEENRAKIEIAKKEEDTITIESQIDGTVVQVDKFSKTTDKPILTIMNKSPLLINVLVSEDRVQRIDVDQEVLIKPKHLKADSLNGKVVNISDIPYGHDKKRNQSLYKITVQVEGNDDTTEDAEENELLIGSHVTADITLKEVNNVVVIPEESLKNKQVVVLEKGMLVQNKVEIGLRANEKVAVKSGLKENHRILSKADTSIKGDTKYILGVNLNDVNKEAYKRFKMEEKIWMLARGVVQ